MLKKDNDWNMKNATTSPAGARWLYGTCQAELQVPPLPRYSRCGWGRGWWLENLAVPVCEPEPPPETITLWTGSRQAETWVWIECCYLKTKFSDCVTHHIFLKEMSHVVFFPFSPTCAFPYDGVEFWAEESLSVVEDEFHHHWLDTHLHECCCATKTGRLNLSGPETQLQYKPTYFTALRPLRHDPVHWHSRHKWNSSSNGAKLTVCIQLHTGSVNLPEEVRCPDNCQVFSVHVSDRAECGQVGEMSHEELQSPVYKENSNI